MTEMYRGASEKEQACMKKYHFSSDLKCDKLMK